MRQLTFREKIRLFELLGKNRRLAEKRHPMLDKNKAMKIFAYCFIAFWAIYLMVFGFVFAKGFENESIEAYDLLNKGFIIVLIIDFFSRFAMQETPAQIIKPYKLLPIPENFLHNCFLIRIGMSWYNIFWFFFFVPFGMITIALTPYYTISNLIGYLIGIWLMCILNAYWYLFWRTLINHNSLYVIIPILIYAAMIYFGMIAGDCVCDGSMHLMRGCIQWNPISFLIILVGIALWFFINRVFQKKFVYMEIAKVEKVKKVKSREMTFLNRFGQIGEYLKLEIKSIMRNAVVKKQFILGLYCTLLLCCLFAFTDAYDSMPFMRSFICVYCFAAMGVITLTGVMCVEGNYIDGLMSRKESVLELLKAKYYFNCIITIIPALFCILPIVEGKLLIMEALGCMFFSYGVIFPFLFQLAVYNDTTVHLTEKMTKTNQNSKMQILISMAALFVPMGIMFMLISLFTPNIAGLIMFIIGAVGTALSPWWLKNIYKRFMKRRYDNMAGFRATR